MGEIKEVVTTEVKTRGLTKAGDKFETLKQKIKTVSKDSVQTFEKFSSSFGVAMDRVTTTNRQLEENFKKMQQTMRQNRAEEKLRAQAGKMDALIMKSEAFEAKRGKKAIEDITRNMRRFKMEMLSVMFFGMGIKRTFQGLLTPALEIAGVFDVFTAALQILFLPVALQLLDWAIWFMEKVSEMPDFLKKLIGWIVLAGVAIGTFLLAFGAISLGIAGLVLAGGAIFVFFKEIGDVLFGWIPKIGDAGAGLFAFGATAGIVGGILGGLKDVISGILDKIFEMDIVKDTLAGWGFELDDNASGWENLKSVVSQAIDKIKEKIIGLTTSIMIPFKDTKIRLSDFLLLMRIEWNRAVDAIKKKSGEMSSSFEELKDKVSKSLEKMNKVFFGEEGEGGLFQKLEKVDWTLIADGITILAGAIVLLAKAYEAVNKAFTKASEFIQETPGMPGVSSDTIFPPKKHSGGFIPQSGLYNLQAGETVVPANQSFTSSPTINIYTTGGVDDFTMNRISETILRDLATIQGR